MMEANNNLLKIWHFIASQIILFITLLGFMGGFAAWTVGQLQKSFYPIGKGHQLESTVFEIGKALEKQNELLTELRVFIARNVRIINEDSIRNP